jgi:hypothetical protein
LTGLWQRVGTLARLHLRSRSWCIRDYLARHLRPALWRAVTVLPLRELVGVRTVSSLPAPERQVRALQKTSDFARRDYRLYHLCGRCTAPTQPYITGPISDSWGPPPTLPPCFAKNQTNSFLFRFRGWRELALFAGLSAATSIAARTGNRVRPVKQNIDLSSRHPSPS